LVTDSPLSFPPTVSLKDFITSLTAGVEIQVHSPDQPAPQFDAAAAAALREGREVAANELAGEAPPLDLAAGGWAAVQFYCACQFLVCRDATAEKVTQILGAPCPVARSPATDFSVDLIFRFLPDLHERARRLAPDDPLVAALGLWARDWPLSSPGVVLEEPPVLETFRTWPALWRLYVDRVMGRRAADRWRDQGVASQLRADLGAFPELIPAVAESLRRAAVVSSSSLLHPA
jgi:hypothetical protein